MSTHPTSAYSAVSNYRSSTSNSLGTMSSTGYSSGYSNPYGGLTGSSYGGGYSVSKITQASNSALISSSTLSSMSYGSSYPIRANLGSPSETTAKTSSLTGSFTGIKNPGQLPGPLPAPPALNKPEPSDPLSKIRPLPPFCPHNGRGPVTTDDVLEHIGNQEYGSALRDMKESRAGQAAIAGVSNVLKAIGDEVLRDDSTPSQMAQLMQSSQQSSVPIKPLEVSASVGVTISSSGTSVSGGLQYTDKRGNSANIEVSRDPDKTNINISAGKGK